MNLYKTLLESSSNTSYRPKTNNIQEESISIYEYNMSLMSEINNTIAEEHLNAFTEGLFGDAMSDYVMPYAKSRFNFVRLMNDMIDLNVKSINMVYKKTEDIMKQITKEDARIKPYVSDILNFNKSFKITEGWYKFTNLDINIPPYDLDKRVEEDFLKIYDKIDSLLRNNATNPEIEDAIISLYMELSGDTFYKQGDIYDTHNQYRLDEKLLKGILDDISINTSLVYVDSSNYEEQVYAYFRDGHRDPINDTITPDIVKLSFNRYNNSRNTMKNLRTSKDELIKSYLMIKKVAEKSYHTVYSKLPTEKSKIYMDKIMRFEVVKNMCYCNGYNLIFSGRLDANVHAMLQDKKITLYAIQIILNDKGVL